ncbi:hypothetical protein N7461_001288 [Penicillium sp. DV-2018c]|nr:hypothetical protein N7461_001288 [Penicillium sp. DV-2018c]
MQPLPTTEVAMQARAPIGGLSDVPRAWHRMYIPQRASENNTAEKVFHGDNPENTTSGSKDVDCTASGIYRWRFTAVLRSHTGSEWPGYTAVSRG